MRKLYIFCLILLAIVLGANLGKLLAPKNDKLGEVHVTVVVEQYRNGKLINRIVDNKDPFTRNFINIMANYFMYFGSGRTFQMKDTAGTTYNFYINAHLSSGYSYWLLRSTGNYIWIGDGTSAFSIDDYKLTGTWTTKTTSSNPTESVVDPKINYTISASFSMGAAHTIAEVGYSTILQDTGGNNREILLMRDVLPTPISALAGDTVTVTYIIRING